MKTYLVGGAVRDYLLGLPVTERDWVVVGAEPADLLAEGYRLVGRDFPVFLHPTTQEEYALARIETKRGRGYHGFVCNAGPDVTLEQDLARRDLTINAMAMDSDGRVIDPFNGQADLRDKRLRHVAPAFVEDPVRVLRVARFKARLHYLGFELAPETRILMQRMGRDGELDHLVAERVWREWHSSLTTKNPELFISTLRSCGALSIVLPELDALFGVPNLRAYHPEVDTGVHALMSLTVAATLSADPVVRLASLLHDMGKYKTPMETWPAQKGHEILGLPIITALCERLRIPKVYQRLALLAARWHGDIHAIRTLSAPAIVDVLDHTAAWQEGDTFEQLLQVCEADAKGRWVLSPQAHTFLDYPCSEFWRTMRAQCRKLSAQTWVAQGLVGQAIKDALHATRVAQVCALRKQWGFDEVE